jgi:hypothetical protein
MVFRWMAISQAINGPGKSITVKAVSSAIVAEP